MIKFDVLTLFPNMFDGFLNESIIKRAIEDKKIKVGITNFRDYSDKKNNQVDDTPYGGGAGMVLMCQPIFDCVKNIKTKDSKIILADEPTGNLDAVTGTNIMNLLHSISKEENMAVLMITHNEQWLKDFPATVYRCAERRITKESVVG